MMLSTPIPLQIGTVLYIKISNWLNIHCENTDFEAPQFDNFIEYFRPIMLTVCTYSYFVYQTRILEAYSSEWGTVHEK